MEESKKQKVEFFLKIIPEEIIHKKIVYFPIDIKDVEIGCQCFNWVKSIMNWSFEIRDREGHLYSEIDNLKYGPYKIKFSLDIQGDIHYEKHFSIEDVSAVGEFYKYSHDLISYYELEPYIKCECIEWAENFMEWHCDIEEE